MEYLQEVIDRLNKSKKRDLKQNQFHDLNTKYWGIETIKYLFDEDEDYRLYLINYQQCQLSFGKILLAPNECLEKIRPDLIKLINDCKIKLTMNVIFNSIKKCNDKRTLHIKTKASDDINELFDLLKKRMKHILNF